MDQNESLWQFMQQQSGKLLQQTVQHIGFLPTLVRSKHISHFCICWIFSLMIGTPNGHAISQLWQAMQRGFRLE